MTTASLEVQVEVVPRQVSILMSLVLEARLRSDLAAWTDEMAVHGRLWVASTVFLPLV
jgi:hypothetical protein